VAGMSALTTVSDPADVNPCPSCGGTSGVRVRSGASPGVRAWSCAACRTDWAIAVVNPRPFLEHLTATVELAAARSMLRQVIALAAQAPALSDDQVRARLVDLARTTRPGVPPWLMTPRVASEAPAGHWLRDCPRIASRWPAGSRSARHRSPDRCRHPSAHRDRRAARRNTIGAAGGDHAGRRRRQHSQIRSCGSGCWRWPTWPDRRSAPSLRTPEASRCPAKLVV
jgi:hypothetical protein